MPIVYLTGPDLVEVTFGTDIQLINLDGFAIPTRTITDFSVSGDVLLLSIAPYVVAGESNLTISYDGFGNLESLPTFEPVDGFTQPIVNKVEQEYFVTLDDKILAGLGRYYRYNDIVFPAGWLIESGGESLESIAGTGGIELIVDASPASWLYSVDGEVIVTFDEQYLVVDPYT